MCLTIVQVYATKLDSIFVTRALQRNLPGVNDGDLARYLNTYFVRVPEREIDGDRQKVFSYLKLYRNRERPAFELFINGVIEKRFYKYTKARTNFDRAIVKAEKTGNHFLLYALQTNSAFIEAAIGNSAEAMVRYRLAQKQATLLNDIDRHIVLAINISDLYYKNNLFKQALQYLDQAQAMAGAQRSTNFQHENYIYFNKAEIYFRLNQLDSLNKYKELLATRDRKSAGIYEFRKRAYYLWTIAKGRHLEAINQINRLRSDEKYPFSDEDLVYLADTYYKAGMNDSAKLTVNYIVKASAHNDSPFLKFHLYNMLGEIDLKNGDSVDASKKFSTALANLQLHTTRMVQVANISSEMKIDQIAGDFIRKEEAYKRQRLILIFIIVVSVLLIAITIIFYRGIKQKHYYEQLLYKAKHQELAFINSHEVRRHLSNILGLVSLVKDKNMGDDQEKNHIIQSLDHSATSLDTAIKTISKKLDS
ncbi:hypothetical protein LT679_04600 [Mucilaginibacter roseus]|uniref:Tetratricopeptide repeat protein n=1 Tax=Mucilaginibacter roseus TaxID=1528868 RepID=A0ABS8TYD0_9SPHI|nr:hypothetical protein [Mucilaginibacter roseus]MCD8739871.1 hypothetical protein [Mucilaginibacter roseus]